MRKPELGVVLVAAAALLGCGDTKPGASAPAGGSASLAPGAPSGATPGRGPMAIKTEACTGANGCTERTGTALLIDPQIAACRQKGGEVTPTCAGKGTLQACCEMNSGDPTMQLKECRYSEKSEDQASFKTICDAMKGKWTQ